MRHECNNCGKHRCQYGDHAKKYELDCPAFVPLKNFRTPMIELAFHSNIRGLALTLESLNMQVNPNYDGRNELIITA